MDTSFDDVLEEWRVGLVSAGELAMAAVETMAAGADVETMAARLPHQSRVALLEWIAGQPGEAGDVVSIGRGERPVLDDESLARLRRWLADEIASPSARLEHREA